MKGPPAPQPASSVTGEILDGAKTQDWLARSFVERHQSDIRFDHDRGRWHCWNSGQWRVDKKQIILNQVRAHCQFHDRPKKPKFGNANAIRGVELLARSDPAVAVTSEVWDTHSYFLGTPGAYIDLRSACPIEPERNLLITQSTIVAPEAGEPTRWLEFLHEACGHSDDYMNFIARMLGYCLTGDTKEHALFFMIGPGGTGKSTLVNMTKEIFGSYGTTAPMETFTLGKGNNHPTDLAGLNGKRLVTASETEQGRAWAEARIKQLTGGDRISARFMRQDFFEFTPEFKLLVVGSHAPVISNCDESMRRRFHVLPFTSVPKVQDLELHEKLVPEAGQILQWIINGARQWQELGLAPPRTVRDATAEYFETQDIFFEWLEAECCVQSGIKDTAARLYGAYSEFRKLNGEPAITQKGFGAELKRRGFHRLTYRDGARTVRGWEGLKLLE